VSEGGQRFHVWDKVKWSREGLAASRGRGRQPSDRGRVTALSRDGSRVYVRLNENLSARDYPADLWERADD